MTTKASTVKGQTAVAAPATSGGDFLWRLGIALAVLGVANAAYLSYVKLADKEVICAATETIDCASVQSSAYSEILGIPISILGLGAYLTILGLFVFESRIALLADYGKALLFSITLFGVLYSGYLTYIEGFVLEKWCLWCVASAVTMVGLFAASTTRLLRSFEDDDEQV